MANEEMTDLKIVKIKLVDDYQLSIGEKINSSKTASKVAIKTIAKEVGSFDREVLFSLNLTTKNEVINASMIHMGSINSSVAHPREIFKASILSNAAKVILFHNHPSGDLTPSQADIDFTKRIIATGDVLGIEVLDHLVVNQLGDYLSIISEYDMTLDKSLVLETATSWTGIKEEMAELEIPSITKSEQVLTGETVQESTTYKGKTKEEKKQELEALSKVVQDKVDSFIRNPELVKDFLLFKRQFPNYSAKNTMLIYSQKPTALGVGAYGFWKKKGYPVKRGEKGIRIYSPMTSEMLLDSNGKIVTTLEKATEEEKNLLKIGRYTKRTIVSGYQPKAVFDISQTTAPLESYPKLVRTGYELENITNYQIQNIALNSLMKEQNIQFVDYDKGRVGLNTYGYYIPASDEIFLQPDLTSVARFKTLSHELAHGMLHKTSKLSKEAEEFQAQMVSVIVSDTLQIPVKDEDYGYIKDYSEKLSEVERRELTEEVLEVANQILEQFENTLQKVQSQEFTKEEQQELERLGLSERSTLSFTDKLEVLQYPANDNQKMTLAKKIIDDSISKLPKEDQEVKRNEEEAFLRNKVKEKHPYYRIGLLEEAVIKQTDSQQIEVTMISINGKETKQVFDEEEQVIELLQKKEAYPAPDTAMTYVKTSIEMKHTQERHLHQNQQKEQERQL
ncbi:MAG: JAB domain-containing protein [Capnocytophaga sp.]|nr:JAB domain-containing protein [Capnocytophaga sp.]